MAGPAAVVRLGAVVVVVVVVHSATGGVADIAPAGAHRIEMSVGSSLPRNPRCDSIGGGGAGCDRSWLRERLAGGAPVAPRRRIRRGAWQERAPVAGGSSTIYVGKSDDS